MTINYPNHSLVGIKFCYLSLQIVFREGSNSSNIFYTTLMWNLLFGKRHCSFRFAKDIILNSKINKLYYLLNELVSNSFTYLLVSRHFLSFFLDDVHGSLKSLLKGMTHHQKLEDAVFDTSFDNCSKCDVIPSFLLFFEISHFIILISATEKEINKMSRLIYARCRKKNTYIYFN